MFKTKNEVIVIQAEAINSLNTNIVFWSHDRGTAKLIFQLKKDGGNQTLAEGTIVPICLEFNSSNESGRGRHIYHAVIEDAVNGIVSIVLEDNILGYQGRVDGSIYIELPDSRSLDTAGRFTFDIRRSPIDETIPELEDFYWEGFNGILETAKELIGTVKSDCQKLLNQITADVSDLENRTRTIESKQAEILKSIADNELATKEELEQAKSESSANVIAKIDERNFVDAWKMPDGTFTNVYPAENLFSTKDWQNRPSFDVDGVPAIKISLEQNTEYILSTNIPNWTDKITCDLFVFNSSGTPISATTGVALNKPRKATTLADGIIIVAMRNREFSSGTFWAKLEKGTTPTIYTPSPSEDPLNAYPKYKGQRLADSDNPDDYDWSYTDEYVDYLIAANHVENLATQEEAENGTDNTKIMTPLRTAQQIDKKAVTIAGNQTIGGIKNFQDGLLVNDKLPVLTKSTTDFATTDSTVNPAMFGGGYIKLYRRGDLVYLTASFKLAVEKFNQGVWFNPPDWARPIENARFSLKREDGTNALFIFASPENGDNTIICSDKVSANTWLNGSATWMAKDPY